MSHISIDCPFKDEPGFLNRHIDHEYQAFLAEIGEKTGFSFLYYLIFYFLFIFCLFSFPYSKS